MKDQKLIHFKFDPKTTFEILFSIEDEKMKSTKTSDCFRAVGHIDGIKKFVGVAHYSKETGEFIAVKDVKDIFDREWLTENSLNIIRRYEPGMLTLRGLHYQLVGLGMINHVRLYKRAVSAMIEARRNGIVRYETFSDHDREMIGSTSYEETQIDDSIETAKREISAWMTYYSKNRWENQPYYVEVFIEKKALQGVFQKTCKKNKVALGACKGYPSLTFLNDTAQRFIEAEAVGKKPVIIYFGDYDPSGEDIPRSIGDNLSKDFGIDVDVHRVALMEHQVVEWKLPPAPVKAGDSRTGNWDGLGQVELDAVDPDKLMDLCQDAIDEFFDEELFDELKQQEKEETKQYQRELKDYVNNLKDDENEG